MLPISNIARVVVNASRAAAVPTSFDTGLLLVKYASFTADDRLIVLNSMEEANAALTELGFDATTETYKSVIKYFSQSPAPGRLTLRTLTAGRGS